jgi:hypothetical protein
MAGSDDSISTTILEEYFRFSLHVYFCWVSMAIDFCLGSGNQTLIELGESKLLEKKVLLSK